nr:MAG TPA: Tetrahydromethanopterin S-methyltransferase, subunit C [Caudoviricetes sp.]
MDGIQKVLVGPDENQKRHYKLSRKSGPLIMSSQ